MKNHINLATSNPFTAAQAFRAADNHTHLYQDYATLLQCIEAHAKEGHFVIEVPVKAYSEYRMALEELGYKVTFTSDGFTRISWERPSLTN